MIKILTEQDLYNASMLSKLQSYLRRRYKSKADLVTLARRDPNFAVMKLRSFELERR